MERVRELFWGHVQVQGLEDCWEWKGKIQSNGYGAFSSGRNYGISEKASRASWELTRGLIPDNLCVLHSCDNRRCCNPLHLRLGTHQENMVDRDQRRGTYQASGDKHGKSKLTSEMVRMIRLDLRTNRAIAREYGLTPSAISKVRLGHTWRRI